MMRADRLLSLLMLLQSRGRMTACELAAELEVSERTIYRDIDALSVTGVPVYGEAGPEGGYSLLDSYRTTLTGLSAGEVRALFMLSIPTPLATLGMSQELKAALLKLSAALPDARRRDEERVRQRFYLDATVWHEPEDAVPHLQTLHQAVWEDRRLYIKYRFWSAEIEREVDPCGLVAKAGIWYLVYAYEGRMRVQRVSQLLEARLSADPGHRPADLDLAAFWRDWCAERERSHTLYAVTVRVAPHFLPALVHYLGEPIRERIAQAGPPDAEGWTRLELAFESLEAARDRLLDFGSGVEVLEPYALRRSLLDVAEQIVELYTHRDSIRG
jgi:predicted DNA-binding transcriptional regulator YafY